MRLPQGPWFPWSREFRWDRWPWQGTRRHEIDCFRDQRELAAFVEMVSTTIGVPAREAGFVFRPDASQVTRLGGQRQVSVLYEADPEHVADRVELTDDERASCVDLWVYWSPDDGQLDVSLPGRLRASRPRAVGREDLRAALEAHGRALTEQLTADR